MIPIIQKWYGERFVLRAVLHLYLEKKMSLFEKTNPLIAVSLLAVASLVGQNNQMPSSNCSRPAAPSMSAGCKPPTGPDASGSWDVFTEASFIFWNPSQENMELGIVSNTSNALYTVHGNTVNLDFDYKPGFKVGLGVNLDRDNWDLYSQYTWFRGNHHTHTSLDPAGFDVLLPKWEIPDISHPRYFGGREDWRLHMDLVDLELGRAYCVGNALSFRTFFGARGAWIRQNIEVDYLDETTGLLARENVSITQRSHSWAVGPRAGIQTNWMLGQGLRMYGNGNGDILFTRYTNMRWHQQATTATGAIATGSFYTVRQKDLNYLRGHLELELGFGWGTYIYQNDWHIDLSAGYGFQIFFDQNMFRTFVDDQQLGVSFMPSGNLYIHGLTASARLDF